MTHTHSKLTHADYLNYSFKLKFSSFLDEVAFSAQWANLKEISCER